MVAQLHGAHDFAVILGHEEPGPVEAGGFEAFAAGEGQDVRMVVGSGRTDQHGLEAPSMGLRELHSGPVRFRQALPKVAGSATGTGGLFRVAAGV